MDRQQEAFARAYERATGQPPPAEAFAFGDNPELADELADLVVTGRKRATASLLADYEQEAEPLPREEETAIVLDGADAPVCVIRTTEVRVVPLSEVDAAFAWDEGEGARSLASWHAAHEAYFRRRCGELGVAFSNELHVVLERFECVWPEASPDAMPS